MAKRKTLADVLRQRIRDCGLSAAELAKLTGTTQPTITVFLNGRDIRLMTAQKLMDYFKITVNS
jgi:plasmid maintenance system antidote protein VapI